MSYFLIRTTRSMLTPMKFDTSDAAGVGAWLLWLGNTLRSEMIGLLECFESWLDFFCNRLFRRNYICLSVIATRKNETAQ